jgi:membrane fusion protein, macrolide-specific efflux system
MVSSQTVPTTLPTLDAEELLATDARSRRARRWRRKRLWLGVGGALVAAVGVTVGLLVSSGQTPTSPLEVTTQRVTATTGTMKQTVSASGTIEPGAQANLNFAVSGTVTAVNATAGQKVTAGQVLATVDPTALQDQVNADQATLSSQQARLSSDEASSSSTTSQIDSDKAAVTSASSQLTTAKANLADASLASTIAGTVASVDLTVGQPVSESGGSGSTGTGPTSSDSSISSTSSDSTSSSAQIVVVSTDSYTVSSSVDDTEVSQIQVGDQAVITPSGSTSVVYGTVSSVGLIASSGSSSVASFPVTIAVTGTPTGLYAGTSASVAITVKQINDAIEVPTAAISYSSDGQATVTKVTGGSTVSQVVTTGVSANGDTQITAGLAAGEVVQERVVKFNGSNGSPRNLFGGNGTTGRTGGGGFPAGGFPGGGGSGELPAGGFSGGGGG